MFPPSGCCCCLLLNFMGCCCNCSSLCKPQHTSLTPPLNKTLSIWRWVQKNCQIILPTMSWVLTPFVCLLGSGRLFDRFWKAFFLLHTGLFGLKKSQTTVFYGKVFNSSTSGSHSSKKCIQLSPGSSQTLNHHNRPELLHSLVSSALAQFGTKNPCVKFH